MSLLKLMEERYTCRRYSTEKIKEEDLLKILEAGRLAPTSHNNQPQKIYVVSSEEAKENLMKDFAYNYKAPCYLVCTYDKNETWRNDLDDNKESGEIDVAIVMTHMMLMAENLGLGACWIGRLNPELVKKNLSIAETEKVVAVLSLGYHREDDRPSKLHNIRKSNEELVRYL
ncbi:MAG: nitroreductase family protein [Fusobacterium sp.]|uniref:nitroreductase family protein n=1 Tax=Fusobacterium sp. TaxID=68766 RepID=UPI0026DC3302|nr:nitroreductase family protein [Fusobacterium sp.]MDO4689794.1 nitroreductase family protein [Fusobacterium sp.]